MRGPAGFLAFLLLPVLAGCFTTPDDDLLPPALEPGRLLCQAGVCNYEATVAPDTRQANELSIAVNPTDPNNIIATGKDYTPDQAGDCVWAGLYTTTDGGRTWVNQNVPGSNWYRLADPVNAPPPNDFSKFWCATDPVVAFGPDGTAYWTVMPYQCDRASGSKTGRELVPGTGIGLPDGGLNDWFWTCSAMYVLVSHDKGVTWNEWKEVAFGPRLEHDKQWIATAPNGDVLLCWDRANPAEVGQVTDPVAAQLAGLSKIRCSVSTDKGQSWSEQAELNPTWEGFIPAVDYDANNTAYAVYIDASEPTETQFGGKVLISKSNNGVAWSSPVAIGHYLQPPPGGDYGWPVLRGSDFRIVEAPLMAIDRSTGPYAGSIYVVWFDHSEGEGNVLVSSSRDGGQTWSTPIRPHDDNATQKADQFYPAISVGPDGTVDVSWWDRRDDPDNHLFHVYYTYSKDGGLTWAPNLRVTEKASDEQYSHHQNGMVFLGDYRDQDSSAQGAHLVWVDTRNQKADVFVATVQR